MNHDKLTIRELRARPVLVPMQRPLVTSGGAVDAAPLVLVDLFTEEGVQGCSYVFCYTPAALEPMALLLKKIGESLAGERVAPLALDELLQKKFRLLGAQGLIGMALAGIDIAAWDALARAAALPLVRFLGGEARPIPAYNSNGLGIIGPERAAAEALELAEPGFGAVKVRLGYPDVASDIAVVRAVRNTVGDDILLMSDFNQTLSPAEAQTRVAHLDDEGLYWIEEPTRADDYDGHAQICATSRTPIQLGENCWGPHDMDKALTAGSCDLFMPDVVKIGGVTGWLRAAALAEARAMPVSSHLFPELSAHLLAITPTRHWLEYVDWANPILAQPIAIEDGNAIIPDAPGHGMAWDEDAVRKYMR
ncbi:MAG: enolase C-terminal domain-like protein [Gammaproteobacteria bacterium]